MCTNTVKNKKPQREEATHSKLLFSKGLAESMQAAPKEGLLELFSNVPGQCLGFFSGQSLMTLGFLISVAGVLEAESTFVN